MKHFFLLIAMSALSFTFFSQSFAETATTTQQISVNIPEVDLLAIPSPVVINLTQGDDGYYSGQGMFSYAITSNSGISATTKQIIARLPNANLGAIGRLAITMTSPSGTLKTTLFKNGETEDKILATNILNVVKKNMALSITLEKLSAEVVQPYLDQTTLQAAYPLEVMYTLGQ